MWHYFSIKHRRETLRFFNSLCSLQLLKGIFKNRAFQSLFGLTPRYNFIRHLSARLAGGQRYQKLQAKAVEKGKESQSLIKQKTRACFYPEIWKNLEKLDEVGALNPGWPKQPELQPGTRSEAAWGEGRGQEGGWQTPSLPSHTWTGAEDASAPPQPQHHWTTPCSLWVHCGVDVLPHLRRFLRPPDGQTCWAAVLCWALLI